MMLDEEKDAALSPQAARAVELARLSLGMMSPQQRVQGLLRVTERTARHRGFRLSPLRGGALALAVAAAVVLGINGWQRGARSDRLSYEVEGGAVQQDGSVQADTSSRPKVRFSDGTEVQLAEMARAHIVSVNEQGARVALDRGEVHARVVHRSEAQWLFDAGPFLVTVTGTAFALSWAPEDERLDLRLENGAVVVSGPLPGKPIAVRAGQWLTLRQRTGEVLLRELDLQQGAEASPAPVPSSSDRAEEPSAAPAPEPLGAPAAEPTTAVALAAEPAPAAEPTTAAAPAAEPTPAAGPRRDWAGKLAAGKLDVIVDEAQRRGLDASLAESSNEELSALADAARYTRRSDIARRALLAQRRRFPATQRGKDAAFLLGRLAETQEGGAAALAWFETYLKEAPQGAYASEALGRKMVIVQRLHGDAQAETVARAYLRRFPGGTYAQAARALARTP
ncbi:FecR domain-containing protein [Sorangium sp. So ce1151]|uniref:FecR domain-containing protein n=1 Tax=Sorangium sp. So ce1151 TaxID=3133332 RepID=UPI003F623C9D